MKIIYFNRDCTSNLKTGVNKKILSQVKALNNQGYETNAHFITNTQCNLNKEPYLKYIHIDQISQLNKNVNNLIQREKIINEKLYQLITSLSEEDILYMRFPYPSYFFHKILSKPRLCKIVTEHQTIEYVEYKKQKKYLYNVSDIIWGNKIRKNLDGMIGVTPEITKYQQDRIKDYNLPTVTITNGFDVNSVPLKKKKIFDGCNLNVICVANFNYWHGIERFLHGMAKCNHKINVHLHLVGDGTPLLYIKKLSHELGIRKMISFHGFLSGKKLDELFDQMHIAIGILGAHRKGLTETSSLKVREYCSRGIPIISCSTDPDFPQSIPFMCKLPDDESPININFIAQFMLHFKNNPA